MTQHWIDTLQRVDACTEAVAWARHYPDFATAWRECQRGDWMLWWIGRIATTEADHKALVLAACACARLALKHVPDGETRPHTAILTAERWARGHAGVTLADVRDASAAAAADAYAAAYAAASAAYASAPYAAASAASSAAASAFYAAAYDARADTLARCARIVRRHYPTPPTHEPKGPSWDM